jgi:serine/threonine-protein kinase SRK2
VVQRISIQEIKNHEWFLKNLPADLVDLADRSYDFEDPNHPPQSIEEIMRIISEARVAGAGTGNYFGDDPIDDMDMNDDVDVDPDVDSSGEFVCAM